MTKTVLSCAVALAFALTTNTAISAEKISTEKCSPVTASFLVDYSGSMMESFNKDEEAVQEHKNSVQSGLTEEFSDEDKQFNKIERMKYAKELLKKISAKVAQSDSRIGLYTVAPYTQIVPMENRTEPQFIDGVNALKENMEVMGRRTPLGIGIEEHSRTLKDSGADGAVILLTNGEVNRGRDSIESLKKFYEAHPESCLSIISFADTALGKRQIADLAAVKPCSKVIEARQIFKDEQALDKLLQASLNRNCEPMLSVTGINFAFDKYNIDPKSEKVLTDALNFIKQQDPDELIEINGWTDAIGSDAYNKTLSLNRAKAVRQWLINHGIDRKRLTVKGNGKSFKFDNRTAEGRYQNRRMDFKFHKSGITTDERQASLTDK